MLWLLAVQMFRAIRHPNDYAESLWLLTYQFGLIRRSLPGEVLSWWTAVPSAFAISVLGTTALAACVTMIFVIGLRTIRRLQWSSTGVAVVSVVFSSYLIVVLGHLNGYFDHIVVVLVAGSTAAVLAGRPLPAGLLLVVGSLVHEAIVVFFPIVWTAWWLRTTPAREPRLWSKGWPLLLPLVPVVAILVTPVPAGFGAAFTHKLSRFDYILNDLAIVTPEWLATPLTVYFQSQLPLFLEDALAGWPSAAIWFSTLTLLAAIARVAPASERVRTTVLAGALIGLPRLLHLIAWDNLRFASYSIVAAFLVLWICTELYGDSAPPSPVILAMCVAAIVLNAGVSAPLMDGEVDRLSRALRLVACLPAVAAVAWLYRAERIQGAGISEKRARNPEPGSRPVYR